MALAIALLASGGDAARAEPACVAGPVGDRFPTCFDPGNRLVVGAAIAGGGDGGAGGAGGAAAVGSAGLALRHVVVTDDPAVSWRLEHAVADARWAEARLDVTAYRGRFIRHSRDGRLLLPTSPPRKVFLPFDLGAEAEVGALVRRAAVPGGIELGVVRTALLVEVLRSGSFRRRLSIGAAGRWDVRGRLVDGALSADEHRVTPLTMAAAAAHVEAADGLTSIDLAGEGGRTWSTTGGWITDWRARAAVERVVLAIDDRPLSIFGEAGYEAGERGGGHASVGLRFGVVARPAAPR